MSEQQFQRGDVVGVADDLGSYMSHFPSGGEAIVMYSYRDRYGGRPDSPSDYSLMFMDGSEVAWYRESQLTFLRRGGESEIQRIIAEREARTSQESDLRWIAANWPTIRTKVPGASAAELMRRVGITNPWGSEGEGMAWYANWEQTFAAVDPILSATPTDPEIALLGIRLAPIDVRYR